MVCLFNLAAHRQGYRVTTIHMGNGWVTLQPCLCAAELNHVKTIEFPGESVQISLLQLPLCCWHQF